MNSPKTCSLLSISQGKFGEVCVCSRKDINENWMLTYADDSLLHAAKTAHEQFFAVELNQV
jgi:hypothetical protein